jgi:acetyl esterase/lipase
MQSHCIVLLPDHGPGRSSAGSDPTLAARAPESHPGASQETIRVAPEGDHVVSNVQKPSITPYVPSHDVATGSAVIVIPGEGHSEIWIDHEGYAVAEWLSSHGVAAFVLKYRLARAKGSTYTVEGTALGDAKRAIRLVRSRGRQFGIDPEHIGVIGSLQVSAMVLAYAKAIRNRSLTGRNIFLSGREDRA